MVMVAADADQRLSATVSMQGTAYVRHVDRATSNGDEGEFEGCNAAGTGPGDFLCSEDGKVLRDETHRRIAAGPGYDGLYNTTSTISDGYGGTLQASVKEPLFARANQFIGGVAYDGSHVGFLQRAELGHLTFNRGVQGENTYLLDDEFRTDLEVESRNVGVYVTDTFNIIEPLAINASARLNVANVELDDRAGSALDGDHTFTRVNPAFGATLTPVPALTVFAGYNEANRAPSASELACADPNRPCRVPNAFVADPPLSQVVSRGVEVGVRARVGADPKRPLLEGSLAGFGIRNSNDILFVAGSRVGTGYFQNAGTTQRLGLEAALSGQAGIVSFYASYTLLRATFESALALPGGANPGAHPAGAAGDDDDDDAGGDDDDDDEGGVIDVHKGDRIPGLPTHAFKAGVDVSPWPRLTLGVSTIAQTSQPFRGDEANLMQQVPGYAVLNAHASYQLLDHLQLIVNAVNLLNNKYETFGIVANPSEVFPDMSDPRFLGPGAPLGVWAGIVAR
jgi:outer membrane receptor protein involved in Fe transport